MMRRPITSLAILLIAWFSFNTKGFSQQRSVPANVIELLKPYPVTEKIDAYPYIKMSQSQDKAYEFKTYGFTTTPDNGWNIRIIFDKNWTSTDSIGLEAGVMSYPPVQLGQSIKKYCVSSKIPMQKFKSSVLKFKWRYIDDSKGESELKAYLVDKSGKIISNIKTCSEDGYKSDKSPSKGITHEEIVNYGKIDQEAYIVFEYSAIGNKAETTVNILAVKFDGEIDENYKSIETDYPSYDFGQKNLQESKVEFSQQIKVKRVGFSNECNVVMESDNGFEVSPASFNSDNTTITLKGSFTTKGIYQNNIIITGGGQKLTIPVKVEILDPISFSMDPKGDFGTVFINQSKSIQLKVNIQNLAKDSTVTATYNFDNNADKFFKIGWDENANQTTFKDPEGVLNITFQPKKEGEFNTNITLTINGINQKCSLSAKAIKRPLSDYLKDLKETDPVNAIDYSHPDYSDFYGDTQKLWIVQAAESGFMGYASIDNVNDKNFYHINVNGSDKASTEHGIQYLVTEPINLTKVGGYTLEYEFNNLQFIAKDSKLKVALINKKGEVLQSFTEYDLLKNKNQWKRESFKLNNSFEGQTIGYIAFICEGEILGGWMNQAYALGNIKLYKKNEEAPKPLVVIPKDKLDLLKADPMINEINLFAKYDPKNGQNLAEYNFRTHNNGWGASVLYDSNYAPTDSISFYCNLNADWNATKGNKINKYIASYAINMNRYSKTKLSFSWQYISNKIGAPILKAYLVNAKGELLSQIKEYKDDNFSGKDFNQRGQIHNEEIIIDRKISEPAFVIFEYDGIKDEAETDLRIVAIKFSGENDPSYKAYETSDESVNFGDINITNEGVKVSKTIGVTAFGINGSTSVTMKHGSKGFSVTPSSFSNNQSTLTLNGQFSKMGEYKDKIIISNEEITKEIPVMINVLDKIELQLEENITLPNTYPTENSELNIPVGIKNLPAGSSIKVEVELSGDVEIIKPELQNEDGKNFITLTGNSETDKIFVRFTPQTPGSFITIMTLKYNDLSYTCKIAGTSEEKPLSAYFQNLNEGETITDFNVTEPTYQNNPDFVVINTTPTVSLAGGYIWLNQNITRDPIDSEDHKSLILSMNGTNKPVNDNLSLYMVYNHPIALEQTIGKEFKFIWQNNSVDQKDATLQVILMDKNGEVLHEFKTIGLSNKNYWYEESFAMPEIKNAKTGYIAFILKAKPTTNTEGQNLMFDEIILSKEDYKERVLTVSNDQVTFDPISVGESVKPITINITHKNFSKYATGNIILEDGQGAFEIVPNAGRVKIDSLSDLNISLKATEIGNYSANVTIEANGKIAKINLSASIKTKEISIVADSTKIDLGKFLTLDKPAEKSLKLHVVITNAQKDAKATISIEGNAAFSTTTNELSSEGGDIDINFSEIKTGVYTAKLIIAIGESKLEIPLKAEVVNTTGTQNVYEQKMKVKVENHQIIVFTPHHSTIFIYDGNGRIVKEKTISGEYAFDVIPGMYIISDTKQIEKVLVQ